MIQHKCTQEQKITDLQKSFNDLDKRDALLGNIYVYSNSWIPVNWTNYTARPAI